MLDIQVNAYKHLDIQTKFSEELLVGHFFSIISTTKHTHPLGRILKALVYLLGKWWQNDACVFQFFLA